MLRVDDQRLNYIIQKAIVARRYFDSHNPLAAEMNDRQHLEEIEFLLKLMKYYDVPSSSC